jgi:hypothetical protein
VDNLNKLKQENDESFILIRSEEWRVYIDFLKRRSKKLQNKMNEAVEKGDLTEARVQLALFKDCLKQVDSFVQQTRQNKANITTQSKENVS